MGEMLQLLKSNRKATAGAIIVGLYILLAIFGPLFVPDPTAYVSAPHEAPSWAHTFGTTGQGQDVLAQAVAGARITLSIGFVVGIAVTMIGAFVGIAAGYFGGRIDDGLSLLINVFLVIPGLPLAIILATYLPPGPGSLALVLIVSGWAWNARVFRSQALSLGKKDFIAASKVAGETSSRIVSVEILPNMISLLVSAFIGATVYAIGAQVGLEFLGLGDVGTVTWGTNLYWAANDSALLTGSWWILVPTGLSIALVGFGLTLVNFAIDEVNNPRLRADEAPRTPSEEEIAEPKSTPAELGGNPDIENLPDGTPIVAIDDLVIEFPNRDQTVRAVDGVSITLNKGDWYGLAGESGSGKSTIGYAILKLLAGNARVTRGSLEVLGQQVLFLKDEQLRAFRWRNASMVFQAAMNALNPVATVVDQIIDTLMAHEEISRAESRARARALIKMVGIDRVHLDSYPHQLSGGMRQRVVIAIAMALRPSLLIMDEPTTALDVVVQKEILQRIADLKAAFGFTVLFISHDVPLLMDISNRIGILKEGRLVEEKPVEVLRAGGAEHDYTRELMSPFPDVAPRDIDPTLADGHPVLKVDDLNISFPVGGGLISERKQVLHDVGFELRAGEIVALVGESGSGKSTIARCIARVETPDSGVIELDGEDVLKTQKHGATLEYRGDVQMIFQDPFGSLNPVHRIGHHIKRPLERHDKGGKDPDNRVAELLEEVDLTPGSDYARRYPHALSGGQRQRVAIARALAVEPRIILADEPTSMLDVATRLEIMNQLRALCDAHGIAILFVTHDLPSARYLADRILVLYAGHVVEQGPAREVLTSPSHPYTRLLLDASPHGEGTFLEPPNPEREAADAAAATNVPAPTGCPFRLRCPHASSTCEEIPPPPQGVGTDHIVHCHIYDDSTDVQRDTA